MKCIMGKCIKTFYLAREIEVFILSSRAQIVYNPMEHKKIFT